MGKHHPEGDSHPKEAPSKGVFDRITDAGISFNRHVESAKHTIAKEYGHLTGADEPKREGPGTMTKVVTGIERYGKERQDAIGAPPDAKLAAAATQLHRGVDPTLAFAESHIGKHLDTLAYSQNPVQVAKALAELKTELTPAHLAKAAATEYATNRLAEFVKNESSHNEAFGHAVHDIETAKGGYDQAQHLKKDLDSIRKETSALKTALAKHDPIGALKHGEKLHEGVQKFEKDLGTAKQFVHDAKLEALHPHAAAHGHGGNLHAGGSTNALLSSPTTIGGQSEVAAPGANVTPAGHPLGHLQPGQHASIARHHDGSVSIHAQAPQSQQHQHQQTAMTR